MVEDIYKVARRKILEELFENDKFPKKISDLDSKQLKKIAVLDKILRISRV
jgi:hypothetical protein